MTLRLAVMLSVVCVECLQAGVGQERLRASKGESKREAPSQSRTAAVSRSNAAGATAVRWIRFPDERLRVCGLPWFERNAPLLWRLPRDSVPHLPARVAALMRFPAGGRIRFSSNTSSLGIRVKTQRVHSLNHMSPIGVRGLDAYVDGAYWSSVAVDKEGEQELMFFQGAAAGPKEISIYLPTYQEIAVVAIGIDEDAELSMSAKSARRPPIVFYGSSIAQGACASRPGTSYEAMLARRLDTDFVNLGFSGAGKAEPVVVDLVREIEASCYVFDLGKSYGAQPAEAYVEMLRSVRSARPNTPLVCITPIFSTRELFNRDYAELSRHVRGVVAKAAGAMIAAGDSNVHLVDGLELLGAGDADAFQEGVHPSDLGFARIADRLEPLFKKILSIEDAAKEAAR